MRRREFLKGVAVPVAGTWAFVARAQQSDGVRRIAIFMDLSERDAEGQARVMAFRKGLQDLGWMEGRNVKFDIRWTGGDPGLMRRYAAQLVGLAPEVIMNGGLPTLVAMQQETRKIPIVFVQVLDPVGAGFVESLAHPGGNITGFVSFEYSMASKWLETLKLVAPQVVRVAAIRDLASPSEMGMLGVIQAVMPAFAMPFIAIGGRDAAEFERGIEGFAREANGGLIILPSPNTLVHRLQDRSKNCGPGLKVLSMAHHRQMFRAGVGGRGTNWAFAWSMERNPAFLNQPLAGIVAGERATSAGTAPGIDQRRATSSAV